MAVLAHPASFATSDQMLGRARGASAREIEEIQLLPVGRIGPLIEMAASQFTHSGAYPKICKSPGVYKMASAALSIQTISGHRAADLAGVFPLAKRAPLVDDMARWEQWAKHAENAAVNKSIPRSFAAGLIGSLIELCDNVFEHSGRPETGLAAYAASPGIFEFVVADCGIGVLQSLRKNPRFAALEDAGAALQIAIRDGNSSLPDPRRGLGIGNLFRALSRDQGELRFRSGNYALSIVGESPTAEGSVDLTEQPWFDGLVISARCNPALAPDLLDR